MRPLHRTSSIEACTILFTLASSLAAVGCGASSAGGGGGEATTSTTTPAQGGGGGASTDLDGGAAIPATCEGYCGALHDACPDNFSTCLADCRRLEGGPCQAELDAYLACLAETISSLSPPTTWWTCMASPRSFCDEGHGRTEAGALAACAAQQGACDLVTTIDQDTANGCTGSAACGDKSYHTACSFGLASGDPSCHTDVDGQRAVACSNPHDASTECDLQATACPMIFPQMP